MRAVDKERIQRLRGSGLGYKAIATRLELPVATVKSFCQRNGLTTTVVTVNAGDACPQCSKPLGERLPGAERKKFCSDACRNKWWDAHADVRAKDKDRRVCAHCSRVFFSRKPRKYCGIPCATAARFGGVIHDARAI